MSAFTHQADPAWVYDDGGRAAAGFRGRCGDCAVRAIAIATATPYREVYDALFELQREFLGPRNGQGPYVTKRGRPLDPSPRNGLLIFPLMAYMHEVAGWYYTSAGELPTTGRAVVHRVNHQVAVIEGVVHDIERPRPSRRTPGTAGRIYGYYSDHRKPRRRRPRGERWPLPDQA